MRNTYTIVVHFIIQGGWAMASWYTDVQCCGNHLACGPMSEDKCGTLSVRLSLSGIKWYSIL